MSSSDKDAGTAGLVSCQPTCALEAAGYTRLGRLTRSSENELPALHGFGPKGFRLLTAALAPRSQAVGSAGRRQRHVVPGYLGQPVDFGSDRSTTVRAAPTCSPATRNSAEGSTT